MEVKDRLYELIMLRLKTVMKDVVLRPHGTDLYFVDTECRNWYFILNSDGSMRFNSNIFDLVFALFSMTQKEYSKIVKKLVEEVMEMPVLKAQRVRSNLNWELSILNSVSKKDWELSNRYGFPRHVVKRYLDYKKTCECETCYFTDML